MPAVNPSPLLPRRRYPDDTREHLPLGVRVRWSAPELDAALASESDPASSEALALRAAQLADPAKQEQLARSINDLVLLADGHFGAQLPTTRAPISADRVRTSRKPLLGYVNGYSAKGPTLPAGLPSSTCCSRTPEVRSIVMSSRAISFSQGSIRLWQHFDGGTNDHRRSRGFITLSGRVGNGRPVGRTVEGAGTRRPHPPLRPDLRCSQRG
jgi:hypothetical protein